MDTKQKIKEINETLDNYFHNRQPIGVEENQNLGREIMRIDDVSEEYITVLKKFIYYQMKPVKYDVLSWNLF